MAILLLPRSLREHIKTMHNQIANVRTTSILPNIVAQSMTCLVPPLCYTSHVLLYKAEGEAAAAAAVVRWCPHHSCPRGRACGCSRQPDSPREDRRCRRAVTGFGVVFDALSSRRGLGLLLRAGLAARAVVFMGLGDTVVF